ncbi:GPW/gp25 family protein [Pseudomonas sp. C9-3]|uniref:GPW/gp25 family protein n=1 Tax=Pseudomonas sp. C9-3 TaxID=3078264 RepID=UPI0028F13E9A|nr:GPW/gp25 family protein [Pseudomonas sp. C9-3]
MNSQTGSTLGLLDHIRQSVADIITTPLGSRVMRREYGSQVPELIDAPFNGTTQVRLYAATAMALMRWEPRIRLSRVQITAASFAGVAELQLEGTLVNDNAALSLAIPLQLGASQ